MKKSKKDKNKPKVTDWIQAIAAAISIPAAIVAFIVFFQKDIELQYQINKLDTIANQSLEHTKLLTNQVELLKDELEFQKQQHELTLSHRQTEIEPKLSIEFEHYNGDIVSANLINSGKSAKIIKFVENNPNDFIIDIPFQYIGEGKEKQIFFRYKNPDVRDNNTVLNFTIIYEDLDKKTRSKNFRFKDIEGIINEKYKNNMGA